MKILLSSDFKTELGTIKTWVESDTEDSILSNDNFLTTVSHKITLQTFELQNDWLKPHMNCESFIGWRWFIEKIGDRDKTLTLFCQLTDPQSDTTQGGNSGEYLDAVEIENKTHHLHIGTEDGEIMRFRAMKNNCMPKRFENRLGFEYSLTKYIDFGFKTSIPKLFTGEEIYFHFLVATNKKRSSQDNQNEADLSTWFAVDCHKEFIDNYLQRQESNAIASIKFG